METAVSQHSLDVIFREARTFSSWMDRPVSEEQIQAIYDLMKMGPTSANCCPARIVFVRSTDAKEKLKPTLAPGNIEKTMAAPLTAIIAYDLEFYEKLPMLFPHADARSWFAGNKELIESTAFRNGALQGAYFILAARSVGLDCGPMSGFDNDAVDRAFFSGTSYRSNFLCNLGYGNRAELHPRSPRMDFGEVCKFA